jgi:uncharacterized protein DUF4440
MRTLPATGRIIALTCFGSLLSHSSWAQMSARDSTYFATTAQALLDAVTNGDSAVWAPRLAPEWFLSDEEGHHITREAFLQGLHPLPPGQQGKLTVANIHFVSAPSLVVMSYDAQEEHHYYGQLLMTTFHMTDVYVRRGGRWLQLAAQATALPRLLEGKRLDPALLHDYAGTYALTPDIQLLVAVKDSGLLMGRTGRDPQPLYALDDRVFIRHGVRGFWVFERDTSGKVVTLVNWRDNNAVIWHCAP